jgi:hypothetical protein
MSVHELKEAFGDILPGSLRPGYCREKGDGHDFNATLAYARRLKKACGRCRGCWVTMTYFVPQVLVCCLCVGHTTVDTRYTLDTMRTYDTHVVVHSRLVLILIRIVNVAGVETERSDRHTIPATTINGKGSTEEGHWEPRPNLARKFYTANRNTVLQGPVSVSETGKLLGTIAPPENDMTHARVTQHRFGTDYQGHHHKDMAELAPGNRDHSAVSLCLRVYK